MNESLHAWVSSRVKISTEHSTTRRPSSSSRWATRWAIYLRPSRSFDPPSTPAMEIRVVPLHNLYVKSMVLAAVRAPFSQNPTGLVPQFNGTPVSVSEIGFTPGKKASSVRAFDNVESRKGYSGLYQFGASYNPGKFTSPTSATPRSGNYLLYWMASQALWRVDPKEAKGLDATFAYDWSPPSINRNNTKLTAGLRFNEPLPVHYSQHDVARLCAKQA